MVKDEEEERRRDFQNWNKNNKMPLSDKNDFRTPEAVFRSLDEKFGPFTLDAAASNENTLTKKYFDIEVNSLKQDWKGKVWCNPPYVRQKDGTTIKDWVEKAWESVKSGIAETVVLLIPGYTSNYYWHNTIFPKASHLVFFRGRLDFTGPNQRAGGASRQASISVVFSQAWKGTGMQVLRMCNRSGAWLTEETFDRDVLKLKLKNGVEAFGQKLEDNKFVVLAGSTANNEPRPSWRSSQVKARKKLIDEGVLEEDGDKLVFKTNVTFNSPSGAAAAVRAAASNGNALWVN